MAKRSAETLPRSRWFAGRVGGQSCRTSKRRSLCRCGCTWLSCQNMMKGEMGFPRDSSSPCFFSRRMCLVHCRRQHGRLEKSGLWAATRPAHGCRGPPRRAFERPHAPYGPTQLRPGCCCYCSSCSSSCSCCSCSCSCSVGGPPPPAQALVASNFWSSSCQPTGASRGRRRFGCSPAFPPAVDSPPLALTGESTRASSAAATGVDGGADPIAGESMAAAGSKVLDTTNAAWGSVGGSS